MLRVNAGGLTFGEDLGIGSTPGRRLRDVDGGLIENIYGDEQDGEIETRIDAEARSGIV